MLFQRIMLSLSLSLSLLLSPSLSIQRSSGPFRPGVAGLIAVYTFARQGRCERPFLSGLNISHAAARPPKAAIAGVAGSAASVTRRRCASLSRRLFRGSYRRANSAGVPCRKVVVKMAACEGTPSVNPNCEVVRGQTFEVGPRYTNLSYMGEGAYGMVV